MSTEENKVLSRRIFDEAASQGNFAVIDEAIAPTFVPDLHYTLEEVVAEGEKVVVHWTATGTHQGDMMGIPPTGKAVKAPGITIFSFANGHIVDGRTVWDALAFLQQLGVVPVPGQTS
jgi:steroid delta-isomerase-like uncharacterized protein